MPRGATEYTPILPDARQSLHRTGFILDSVTWRASSTWGAKLGYSEEDLEDINLKAIQILERVRNDYQNQFSKFVINGCLGPQVDGYKPTEKMNQREAQTYHMRQIETFAKSNADMVTASTITYSEEAIGIVRAAANLVMPVVISFTVETDGNLPSGETLKQAIEAVNCSGAESAAMTLTGGDVNLLNMIISKQFPPMRKGISGRQMATAKRVNRALLTNVGKLGYKCTPMPSKMGVK